MKLSIVLQRPGMSVARLIDGGWSDVQQAVDAARQLLHQRDDLYMATVFVGQTPVYRLDSFGSGRTLAP